MLQVTIVDSDLQRAQATAQLLRLRMNRIARITLYGSAADALAALDMGATVDCHLVQHPLDDDPQLDFLQGVLDHDAHAAVIITAQGGDEDVAIRALKRGAADFLPRRSVTAAALERAVQHAIERSALQRRIEDQQHSLRTFAHVLVHDLRAPLRSVRGGVSMLMEDLPPDLQSQHAEVMGFIRDGADRMDALIVALYRLCETDSVRLNPTDVPLADLVADLRATLRADLVTRGARIEVSGVLPTVHADRAQLSLLLQNIVTNGIKYNRSPDPTVTIGARKTVTGWQIDMSDNGIGISEEETAEIFQPFRRLADAQGHEGMGLGLATCMRIAKRHDATLTCRSEKGRGSTFSLELPRPVGTRAATFGAAFAAHSGMVAAVSR